MATTTGRTLVRLRQLGYQAETVEKVLRMEDLPQKPGRKWTGPPVIRRDLWGFADILATNPKIRENLLVQCTDYTSVANHLTKCRQRQELAVWLSVPTNRFEVWGWKKPTRDGEKWEVQRVEIKAGDLCTVLTTAKKRGKRQTQKGLFDR